MAASTVINVPSIGQSFRVPAVFTEQQIRDNYSGDLPQLANMVAETTYDADGNPTHTFRPRTGNKG